MKKRGLSDLVATVLIVLLALAAVMLVWGFLKPAFERTGSQIDLRSQCIDIEVEPTACTYDSNNTAVVTVKVLSGEPTQVYAAVEFDDNTANANRVTAPPMLATKAVTVVNVSAGAPVTAKAAGVVTDTQNNYEICTESPVSMPCTAV